MKKLMLCTLASMVMLAGSLPAETLISSTQAGGYDAYKEKTQKRQADYASEMLKRYQIFQQQYLERYNAYKAKVIGTWGVAEVSGADKFVSYNQALDKKVVVDYLTNEIRISVVEDKHQPRAVDIAAELSMLSQVSISKALANDPVAPNEKSNDHRSLLESALGLDVKPDVLLENVSVNVQPLTLDNDAEQQALNQVEQEFTQREFVPELLQKTDEQADNPEVDLSQKKSDALVFEKLKSKALSQVSTAYSDARKTKDVVNKQIRTYVITLPNQAMLNRANAYKVPIITQAQKLGLDPALIFAITQTESSFNPLAQSPIPAFGLMQIVPQSAGVDVNEFINSKSTPPSAKQLFEPDTNLQFGSTYLHLLNNRYLRKIENPQSRLYSVIAAYNTGAGNVAAVFHPKREKKLRLAVEQINRLTPDEVYSRLTNELPYDETRKYLKRVVGSLGQYQEAFDKKWAPTQL